MADNDKLVLPAPGANQKAGRLRWVATLAILSLVALGLGGGFGTLMVSSIEKAVIAKYKAETEAKALPASPYSGDIALKSVPPVVTNLANSGSDWIRIESSIVFKRGIDKNPEVMAAETRQDLLAFLRTVSLAQIQGPSGLLHLREDLNERVRLRSKGDIQELILETLVIQ